MGIETDLNVNPYYDDFDETKDFHRVLFKPAVPLQARELTQLQTILQNQVEKFGQFTFKEGSIVKGCTFTFDRNIRYAKLLDKDSTGTDINMNLFGEGDYIRNASNLVARVVDTKTGLESQNPDLNTIFFNYVNTGNSATSNTAFAAASEVEIYPASTGIEHIQFAGIPSTVNVNANDTVSVVTSLKGSGFSANVVVVDGTNQFFNVAVSANGTGFSVDDLPTATILAANGVGLKHANGSSYDLATDIADGTVTVDVQLIKTGNVSIANTDFEQTGNTEFNVLGTSYQMKVQDGVIFQKGTFQRFEAQDIIVSKYTSKPDEVTVGVATTEAFINSSSDTSLLDNASGFANENAPGADRLQLKPTLVVNTIANAVASNNFLRLVEFQHGMPISLNSDAQLSGLGEIIQKRLYETSGDYVVNPFAIASEGQPGNTTHFTTVVGAGVGYNKGQRFELVNPSRIITRKSTATANIVNQEISINYGNFVEIDELIGNFGLEQNDVVLLMDKQFNSISASNTSTIDFTSSSTYTNANTTLDYAGTKGNVVGTARVRAVEQAGSDGNKSTSKFNMYIYDVKMATGKSFNKDAKSVYHYSGTDYNGSNSQTNKSVVGLADLILQNNQSRILEQDPADRDLLFPLGQVGIKSVSNTASYTFESSATGTFSTSGVASLSKAGTQNWGFGTAADSLSESQEDELLIISNTTIVSSDVIDSSVTVNTDSDILTTVTTTDLFEGDYIRVANSTANGGIYQIIQKMGSAVKVNQNITGIANTSAGTISLAYPKGRAVSLKNRSTANAAVGAFSSGQTLTINLGKSFSSTWDFDVVHNVRETSAPGIKKNIKTTEVLLYTGNNAGNTVGPWSLGIPDGINITKVYVASSNVATGSAIATNISNGTLADKTKEFMLDKGQEGSKYNLTKLKQKPGSSYTIPANGTIAVKFRHFNIDTGTGFATYQSYHDAIDDANTANTTAITTQEIPVFESNISGKEYSLRDHVDFRPYVDSTATAEATWAASSASINPAATEQITGAQFTSTPNKLWSSTIEYYLPRKDRLVIEDGRLHIVRGLPNVNPELPTKPTNSMQLGTIDVPVYPSLDAQAARFYKRPDLGVKIRATQLKRYTMSDIKAIDDRVNNLEYYTSLSLLEKLTADEVIPGRNDPTVNRFKNGFIVDNFVNYTTGNPLNTEFKAGFDAARKILTSKFEQYNIGFKYATASGMVKINDVMMTDYKNRLIIQQPYATQDRRCTSAYWQYNGNIKLYPDYLNHVDVTRSAESQVQIDIDLASPTLSLLEELNKVVPMQTTEETVIAESETTNMVSSVRIDNTTTQTFETVTQQTIEKTTKGIGVSSKTTSKKVGEFVTNIAFQPYIPGVDIHFVALGLRPNLRHYAYFDDAKVFDDVAPAVIENTVDSSRDELDVLSTDTAKQMIKRSNAFGTALTANSSGGLAGVFRIPAGTFFAGERKFALADVSNLSQINETVSAASVKFNCYNFSIEKGDVVINTREPVLSETITGNIFDQTSNTIGNTVIIVDPVDPPHPPANTGANTDLGDFDDQRDTGCDDIVFNSEQELWIPPEDELDDGRGVTQNRTRAVRCAPGCPEALLDDLQRRGVNRGNRNRRRNLTEQEFMCAQYIDPLAQSFLLQEEMFNGSSLGYLTSLDLYFADKNPDLGCFVEIREVVGGFPSNKIIPFGTATLKAANINTSTDGSVATRVNFIGPVAVEVGREYCFVVKPMANNPETKLFTAKAGQNNLVTGEAINQDWGDGTMFLSSNDRTWTPYTDEDAKFKLYAAYFNSASSAVELTNDDYEFFTPDANGINGSFNEGEEVFQNKAATYANVTFAAGNSSIVAGTGEDLSGIASGTKIVVKNANNEFDVVEVSSSNTSTISLRGAPDITEATGDAGEVLLTPVGTFAQLDSNTSTIMINDSTATNSTFLFGTGNTLIGCSSGANCVISGVVDNNISYLEPRVYNNVPNNTAVNVSIKGAKVSDSTNTAFERIKTNDRNYFDTPIKIRSKSNEISGTTVNKSLTIRHNLTSTNRFVSPFVDLQSQSALVYENVINNDSTNEHITDGGNANAKYVSRIVTLGEGLDAEDIKVFVNAYKPTGTDVKVYAKAVNQADDLGFDKGVWSELQATKNKDKISSIENRKDVIEYGFEFKDAPVSTLKSGTVTFSNNATTITGSGTAFSSEFAVGDLVKINQPPFDSNLNYQVSMVTAIASDTSMTIADTISIGDETNGREIFRVNDTDKNQIFRDPESDVINNVSYLATYYNTNNEKFVGYKYLAIKIVMLSNSTSKAPYCQDYRAIAVSV